MYLNVYVISVEKRLQGKGTNMVRFNGPKPSLFLRLLIQMELQNFSLSVSLKDLPQGSAQFWRMTCACHPISVYLCNVLRKPARLHRGVVMTFKSCPEQQVHCVMLKGKNSVKVHCDQKAGHMPVSLPVELDETRLILLMMELIPFCLGWRLFI